MPFSASEECISGEQLDKNNHVSSSMGIQTGNASEEVDEVGRSEYMTDGEPVEKKSNCKHATFKQRWLLTWPWLINKERLRNQHTVDEVQLTISTCTTCF